MIALSQMADSAPRSRTGGDSREGEDAPLGESCERRRVEIRAGDLLVRASEVSTPACACAADFPVAFPGGGPPPTVSRWASGESGPTIEKQRIIAELRWVAERLSDFYEPDEARLWLQSAHPQLSGARPYDLIVSGRTAEVLEVIERLDAGVYL